MTKRFITAILATFIMLTNISVLQAQNLLTNPTFADTNTDGTFGDGWGFFGAAGAGDFFAAGPHAALFPDNPGVNTFGGVFQDVAVTTGTIYEASIPSIFLESNYDTNLLFGIEFRNSTTDTIVDSVIVDVDTSSLLGQFQVPLGVTAVGTAPVGADVARFIFQFNAPYTNAGSSENGFVFDTSLTVVPEPTMGSLIVLGLAVMGWSRASKRRLLRSS